MTNPVRFGIAMERNLLDRFDGLIERRGFENRSEALRDLIRRALDQEAWDAVVEQIAEALRGEYREEHLFLLNQTVSLYDTYGERLAECDQVVAKLLNEAAEAHCAELQLPHPPEPDKSPSKRRPKEAPFEIRKPQYQLVGVDLTAIPKRQALRRIRLRRLRATLPRSGHTLPATACQGTRPPSHARPRYGRRYPD